MKILRTLIFAFMLGVSVVCAVQYVSMLREKMQVQEQLQAQESLVASLEGQKAALTKTIEEERVLRQKLAEETLALKDTLRASKRRMSKLYDAYLDSSRQVDKIAMQTVLLKSEVRDLRAAYQQLETKFARLESENLQYKATMDSVVELKKAIREAKRRARQAKRGAVAQRPAVVPSLPAPSVPEALPELAVQVIDDGQGNRGYIVKDGKPTYPARVRIEVNPAAEEAPSSVQ